MSYSYKNKCGNLLLCNVLCRNGANQHILLVYEFDRELVDCSVLSKNFSVVGYRRSRLATSVDATMLGLEAHI